MISTQQWNVYKNIINKAHLSFNQDTITWRRFIRSNKRYQEDNASNETYTEIALEVLIQYNIFRTWPMSDEGQGGQLDQESIVLMLNKSYLNDLGYLNEHGFFAMDPGKDEFVHQGIKYRAAGETQIAQAGDDPLLFYIVLSREESRTGDNKY